MPNWKRIIVGDAFRLSPDGISHYRDVFLMWPFLLFSLIAIFNLPAPQSAHSSCGIKAAVCAVVAILLAKERLFLFLVALLWVVIRLGSALIYVHDWRVLLGLVLCGGTFFAILQSRAGMDWKPSSVRTKGMSVLDLIAGLSGLGLAIALAIWMKP